MNKENSHLNRELTPFNRGWFRPKHSGSQVNGQTEPTQTDIILQREAVKRRK